MEYTFADKSVSISDIRIETLNGFIKSINSQIEKLIEEKNMIEEELKNRKNLRVKEKK